MEDKKEMANHMQEKNFEKQMEERIRESAKSLDVPPELKPEKLEELLEKRGREKKLWIIRRHPVAAACISLLLAGTASVGLMFGGRLGIQQGTQEVLTEKQEETLETKAEELEYFQEAGDYEEVYQVIYERQQKESSRMEVLEGSIASSSSAADTASYGGMDTGGQVSDTNLRTEGVDEGDVVKTDGTWLYVLSTDGTIEIIEAAQGSPKEISAISPENLEDNIRELYLDKDRLYVIADRGEAEVLEGSGQQVSIRRTDTTFLYTYDISDREKPKLLDTGEQGGEYQTSRMVDGYLYLFTKYYPELGETVKAADEDMYLPLNDNGKIPSQDILVPKQGASSEYLTVSAVNLDTGKTESQKSVLLSGADYYVSEKHIYITFYENRYEGRNRTIILQLSYGDGKLETGACASVSGYLIDSFCIDEYQQQLRMVCQNGSQSALYVLNTDLELQGKIEDIAPGESLKSARFMGETGYFVTYREIDPLFCVDLKNPQKPEILGELKVSGYSQYLHFYGEDRLLGIGWETDAETGARLGLKFSMFDVSKPGEMKEMHKLVIQDVVYCPALDNYKAVLAWPQDGIVGLSMVQYDQARGVDIGSYLVLSYTEDKGFEQCLIQDFSQGEDNVDPYGLAARARGIVMDSYFYLCGSRQVSGYHRNQGYTMTGQCVW